jgi:2-polyprenyl-3-methyl-5-hydroxy-6-metoxy-1,4-benzoquinol methylase
MVGPKKGISMEIETTNTLTLSILEGAPAYQQWVFEKIRPFLGEEILEAGCGIGSLTGWLLQRGRVIAADVNENYLQTLRNKFQDHSNLRGVALWDIRHKPPRMFSPPIDTIVCSNVLEHIEDDDSVLKNFYNLLPISGRLVLLVPALKSLYNNLDKGLGHYRRYSKNELDQKLRKSGFKTCHLNYFNSPGILGWLVNGTLLQRTLLPGRQVRIFNRIVPFFKLIDRVIPIPVGQSLIAVGEK